MQQKQKIMPPVGCPTALSINFSFYMSPIDYHLKFIDDSWLVYNSLLSILAARGIIDQKLRHCSIVRA
jgi:hypothetical protein